MTGEELISAIVSNPILMGLEDCPGVPAQMSCAVYGKLQDDDGKDVITGVIANDTSMKYQIGQAILFNDDRSKTAVWHFAIESPVHHFVVIPWYNPSSGAMYTKVYTVFMAYELKKETGKKGYTVREYVEKAPPAPSGTKGYKKSWTETELSTMLSDLLTKENAWEDYFGKVGKAQAKKIHYYKYKITTLNSAVSNVNQYRTLCKKTT
ncbi:hypothetical protein [Pseudomonas sp. 910_21]|uniref:hypothetical protein n=1 Tax=Pseudomonas sp. 910_21 TaxID=2604460 RepID=UPI004064818B